MEKAEGKRISGAEARRTLISATLENAARSPFYMELWGTKPNVADLTTLPIVHKAELVEAGHRAQLRDCGPFKEKFTSGTTEQPFVHIVGEREQKSLAEFYRLLDARRYGPVVPRGIRFHDIHVAFERQIPTPTRFHDLSIYGVGTFGYALEVLSATQNEPGVEPHCSVLVAGERILLALTDFAEALGSPKNRLKHIITYGNYLGASSRQRYRNIWGVEVTDRYGLAEAVGGATQSADCGWYHFDPVLLPEVIGYRSGKQLEEGVGALVLTTLYPFQQCQPLIRYWTGDLVEVTFSRSSRAGLAIRPLGRLSQGVPAVEGDSWLLTPDILFEQIEQRTDVVRSPLFRDSPQVHDPHRCGLCNYRVDWRPNSSDGGVDISVEVPFTVRNEQALTAASELEERLLVHSPLLSLAVEAGEARFRVIPVDTFVAP